MHRDQAVDIVAKIAANFPRLQGQAHQRRGDDWTVQVAVPACTLEAESVDEARVLWRFLGRADRA